MPSPAPSKAMLTLTLTIGMIPLAINIYSATEESSISRGMYVREGGALNKVGVTNYNQITGKNVDRDAIVKCVETPDGLVEITDAEIQSILAAENGTCEFLGFLSVDKFHYSTEKQYQVRPQKVKGTKQPHEKPFMLIMEAMRETDTVALISFVNRGRTRYAAIGADGTMVTLRYDEEVREERPLPQVELSEPEKAMGKTFVDTFKVDDAPVFHDDDSAKVMQFAIDKAKTLAEGGEVVLPTAAAAETVAPGMDLMAMMAASLQAATK